MEILGMVFSSEMERIYRSYPHQVSGGQKQRVLIAQAIACGPSLIVADEPTASLDVTTQREIAELFQEIQKRFQAALLLISHSPAFLANLADRIAVLYAGRIVEIGPAREVLWSPQHPYTRALLQCLPVIDEGRPNKKKGPLQVIPGEAVTLSVNQQGCIFEPRCNDRLNVCASHEPELLPISTERDVSCFKFRG
jgi:oligopeptide/dipeptide ABC transporter ATP-binding protein